MPEDVILVILNSVKNLIKSKSYPVQTLLLTPEATIVRKPLQGGGDR